MRNLYSIRPKGFNIGNEAIFIGVSHFIRKSLKRNFNFISIPATTKYENQRKGGLIANTVYEINRNGHGVIVGGGNLYENNELDIDEIAIKALDKPMMIFSVSRGKIYNNNRILVDRTNVMPDHKIKTLHSKTNISLSRDIATKEYLNKIGCDNLLAGCPTLFMNEIPQHLVPMMNHEKTDVLISIRNPILMSIPIELQYQVRETILDSIRLLKANGYRNIKFLCHDHRDIEFANSFTDIDYFYTDDIYTYLTLLRNTKLNLSFRLHSFLPCLAFDIPTIKLSYDERALSFMETINMSEWNINYVKDNVLKEIEYRIKNIKNLDEIKKRNIKNTWAELKNTIETSTNEFAKLVD
jgi:polysaccharide pyruvyl transferase WcaK-like protein